MKSHSTNLAEDELREALALSANARAAQVPVLAHLVGAVFATQVDEEIAARVGSMIEDLAFQLADFPIGARQPSQSGQAFAEAVLDKPVRRAIEDLSAWPKLLEYCLALAIEFEITLKLERRIGLDPVLSPLMQELIASDQTQTAQLAMECLAAQARFIQSMRRMRLPATQLPAELFSALIDRWRKIAVASSGRDQAAMEESLDNMRARYDESTTRHGLMAQLLAGMGRARAPSLKLDHSGVGLFATSLAQQCHDSRERVVFSLQPFQHLFLVIEMRAAGLSADHIAETFGTLEGELSGARALIELDSNLARKLLESVQQPAIGGSDG